MVYLANINLAQNEIQNAVIQPLATAPESPKLGQIYCNSTTSKIMWYNGTAWQTVGVVVESSETNGKITVDGTEMTVYTLPIASANTLGGIKVGTGLSIDANGTLSATGAGTVKGIKVGDSELVKDSDGKVTLGTMASKEASDYLKSSEIASTYVAKNGKDRLMTAAEGTKLEGIATGAEVNVNADWNVSDSESDAYIANKPTALSAFTNDEGFIDNTVSNLANYYLKTETYTKTEVDDFINGIIKATISFVSELPQTGTSNVIYLVPKTNGTGTNVKDEYIWNATDNKYELIGDTAVDLTNYLTKTGDASDTTVAFTAASTRANISTGEALDVIMGKIAKYFGDLSTVAFSGDYDDLSNKPTTIKNAELTISTSQKSNSTTLTGTKVLSVTVKDSTTNEVVLCDVTINGMTITVTCADEPTNALTVVIAYI